MSRGLGDVYKRQAYIMNKGHIVAHVRKEGLQEQTLKELFFTSTQHEVGEAS